LFSITIWGIFYLVPVRDAAGFLEGTTLVVAAVVVETLFPEGKRPFGTEAVPGRTALFANVLLDLLGTVLVLFVPLLRIPEDCNLLILLLDCKADDPDI
jgi:hypothetical protein